MAQLGGFGSTPLEIPKPELVRRINTFKLSVQAIALSHDGKIAIAGGAGGSLKRFRSPNWTQTEPFADNKGWCAWLSFSSDDRFLASTSNGGVRIWDAASGSNLATLKPPIKAYQVHCHPSEPWCFVNGRTGVLISYAVPSGRNLRTERTRYQEVVASCFVGDGSRVLTSGFTDGVSTVELRNAKSMRVMKSVSITQKRWERVIASPAGDLAIAGGAKGAVAVWSLRTGKRLFFRDSDGAEIRDFQFAPDDRLLWISRSAEPMQVLDIKTMQVHTPSQTLRNSRAFELVPKEGLMLVGGLAWKSNSPYSVFRLKDPEKNKIAAAPTPSPTKMLSHEPPAVSNGRQAIPDTASQREAETQICDALSLVDVWSLRGKEALATAKQIWAITETEKELAIRYVCLVMTAKLAAISGDIDLTKRSARALQEGWVVNRYQQQTALLQLSLKQQLPSSTQAAWNSWAIEICKAAITEAQYATAASAAKVVVAMAQRLNDTDTESDFQKRYSQLEKVAAAQATLKRKPSDGGAHKMLGVFLCEQGQWNRGLKHLASCDDEGWRAAAAEDLKSPTDKDAQQQLAQKWRDLASGEGSEASRVVASANAAHWYRSAGTGLTGLQKLVIEKALNSLPSSKLVRN